MSISTRRGDTGETRLADGTRVSKGEWRVEAAGCVDELNSAIGCARAWCDDSEVAQVALRIQRQLFPLGSAISNKPGGRRPVPEIIDAMVAELDAIVERFERIPGLTLDWTIPGADRVIDLRNGVDARLRDAEHPGPPWSAAW